MYLKQPLFQLISEAYGVTQALRDASSGLRVLMYHSVGTPLPNDSVGWSVSADSFKKQMTWLKDNHARSLVSLTRGMSLAIPGIAITFDDGYRDNLTLAAPILCELSIPFTVFVVPEYIRSQSPLHLSERELRELSSLPDCTIGSHGNTHIRLAETDDQRLHEELRVSRRWIEDKIEKQVYSLAYPHGSTNRKVRDAAKQAGYELGFCTRTGLNLPGRDPLLLCRTEVLRRDGMRLFKLKVQGAWDWHRYRHRDPAWV